MGWPKYLFFFSSKSNISSAFRYAELFSIARSLGIPLRWEHPLPEEPLFTVKVPNESAVRQILSKSILIRGAVELWGSGPSLEALHRDIEKNELIWSSYRDDPSASFRVEVLAYNKKLSCEEKVNKIDSLSYMNFQGNIDLNSPKMLLHFVELYGVHPADISPAGKPLYCWFGRSVGKGQRDLLKKHSLKTRHFIANTSMDPELSLVMTNLGHVRPGSLVFDPFVGSGSILVAAAELGGLVFGCDIDYLTLHGRSRPSRCNMKIREEGESVLSNMQQYGLEGRYIDVMVADSSLSHWRDSIRFDCILTDPPYGVREKTARVGTEKTEVIITEAQRPAHIPQKIDYSTENVIRDLLRFASKYLIQGGHLVFWIPGTRLVPATSHPLHPCLQLISVCQQTLSRYTYRLLYTMKKIREPQLEDEPNVTLPFTYRDLHFSFNDQIPPSEGLKHPVGRRKKRKTTLDQRDLESEKEAVITSN